MRTLSLLLIFTAVIFACKKKVTTDTISSKMAGAHVWTGLEIIHKADPNHHLIDTFYTITFSTVLYAISNDQIMFFDVELGHMDTLYFRYTDTATKKYYFSSYVNFMDYSSLNNSINWYKALARNGREAEWQLHSP